MKKNRITARKHLGDDSASWAVFTDGFPSFTGLTRSEVAYYRKLAQEALDEREGKKETSR